MRRFLYLFIIVGAIVLVVLIGYFLRSRTAAPSPAATPGSLPNAGTQTNPPPSGWTTGNGTGGTQPVYNGQKFGVVAQNQVAAFYIDSSNKVTLVQPDGQVVKIVNGSANVLSSSGITNLIGASFSADGSKVLATFGDPSAPQSSVFDVGSKSWRPLSGTTISPTWSPSGSQIVYLAADDKSGGHTIMTIDAINPQAKPQSILKINAEDLLFSWTNPSQIIVSQRPSASVMGAAWVLNISKKTLSPLLSGSSGLSFIWEKTVNLGLMFRGDKGAGGKLTLVNAGGQTLRELSLHTLPQKCAFELSQPAPGTQQKSATSSAAAGKTGGGATTVVSLICAIPRDQDAFGFATLPDDYFKKRLFTTDDFLRIRLDDGSVSDVFSDKSQGLDAWIPQVVNQTLFFVNRLDQKLYAISLK